MAEPTLERLRELLTRDHRHGCPGHACSCNYNKETRDALIAAFNVLRKQTPAAAELLRLQEQLTSARADAIEECAKVCDISDSIAGMAHSAYVEGRNYCARHIRALSLRAISSAAEGGEK